MKSDASKIDDSKRKNENSEKKNKNSSTLSLHIAAYENYIEAGNGLQNLVENDGKKLCKFGASLKAAVSSTPMDIFEFPRQQTDDKSEPEVMQFTPSQKLLNPNMPSSNPRMNESFLNTTSVDSGKIKILAKIFVNKKEYKRVKLDLELGEISTVKEMIPVVFEKAKILPEYFELLSSTRLNQKTGEYEIVEDDAMLRNFDKFEIHLLKKKEDFQTEICINEQQKLSFDPSSFETMLNVSEVLSSQLDLKDECYEISKFDEETGDYFGFYDGEKFDSTKTYKIKIKKFLEYDISVGPGSSASLSNIQKVGSSEEIKTMDVEKDEKAEDPKGEEPLPQKQVENEVFDTQAMDAAEMPTVESPPSTSDKMIEEPSHSSIVSTKPYVNVESTNISFVSLQQQQQQMPSSSRQTEVEASAKEPNVTVTFEGISRLTFDEKLLGYIETWKKSVLGKPTYVSSFISVFVKKAIKYPDLADLYANLFLELYKAEQEDEEFVHETSLIEITKQKCLEIFESDLARYHQIYNLINEYEDDEAEKIRRLDELAQHEMGRMNGILKFFSQLYRIDFLKFQILQTCLSLFIQNAEENFNELMIECAFILMKEIRPFVLQKQEDASKYADCIKELDKFTEKYPERIQEMKNELKADEEQKTTVTNSSGDELSTSDQGEIEDSNLRSEALNHEINSSSGNRKSGVAGGWLPPHLRQKSPAEAKSIPSESTKTVSSIGSGKSSVVGEYIPPHRRNESSASPKTSVSELPTTTIPFPDVKNMYDSSSQIQSNATPSESQVCSANDNGISPVSSIKTSDFDEHTPPIVSVPSTAANESITSSPSTEIEQQKSPAATHGQSSIISSQDSFDQSLNEEGSNVASDGSLLTFAEMQNPSEFSKSVNEVGNASFVGSEHSNIFATSSPSKKSCPGITVAEPPISNGLSPSKFLINVEIQNPPTLSSNDEDSNASFNGSGYSNAFIDPATPRNLIANNIAPLPPRRKFTFSRRQSNPASLSGLSETAASHGVTNYGNNTSEEYTLRCGESANTLTGARGNDNFLPSRSPFVAQAPSNISKFSTPAATNTVNPNLLPTVDGIPPFQSLASVERKGTKNENAIDFTNGRSSRTSFGRDGSYSGTARTYNNIGFQIPSNRSSRSSKRNQTPPVRPRRQKILSNSSASNVSFGLGSGANNISGASGHLLNSPTTKRGRPASTREFFMDTEQWLREPTPSATQNDIVTVPPPPAKTRFAPPSSSGQEQLNVSSASFGREYAVNNLSASNGYLPDAAGYGGSASSYMGIHGNHIQPSRATPVTVPPPATARLTPQPSRQLNVSSAGLNATANLGREYAINNLSTGNGYLTGTTRYGELANSFMSNPGNPIHSYPLIQSSSSTTPVTAYLPGGTTRPAPPPSGQQQSNVFFPPSSSPSTSNFNKDAFESGFENLLRRYICGTSLDTVVQFLIEHCKAFNNEAKCLQEMFNYSLTNFNFQQENERNSAARLIVQCLKSLPALKNAFPSVFTNYCNWLAEDIERMNGDEMAFKFPKFFGYILASKMFAPKDVVEGFAAFHKFGNQFFASTFAEMGRACRLEGPESRGKVIGKLFKEFAALDQYYKSSEFQQILQSVSFSYDKYRNLKAVLDAYAA